MKSEKEVQTEIIKYVQSRGGYIVKVMRANTSGVADLLMCIHGTFVACEVKAEKYFKNPSAQMSGWQKKHHGMVLDAEGYSVCCASLEQFIEYLDDNLIFL